MQDKITSILKAISDPTRREIFHALVVAAIAMPITEISAQFEMSRQGVTKHIKTLEEAGLVTISSQGRARYCKADAKPLQEVSKWMKFYEGFWNDTLGNLGEYLGTKA